jgi:hypothetical protein
MFALSVFHRDRLVGRSTFEQEEVRIGRNPDNEVRIDNLGVSRYHASIACVEGVHIVKDFGSDNGTFVNGERVLGRRALNDGDKVQLSKFTLVFRGPRLAKVEKVDIRDEKSFALSGQTIVAQIAPAVTEGRCPFLGYIELDQHPAAPKVHRFETDVCVVGSAPECDLVLGTSATVPSKAAIVLRGWGGFFVVALEGVKRNGSPVAGKSKLASRDELAFGSVACAFFMMQAEAAP